MFLTSYRLKRFVLQPTEGFRVIKQFTRMPRREPPRELDEEHECMSSFLWRRLLRLDHNRRRYCAFNGV